MKIITEQRRTAPKGIIYGPPGIGKTTFGASAPKSVVIDCENGSGALKVNGKPVTRTPYLSTWTEIHEALQYMATEKHDYQAIAIDSLDWCLRRIEEHVSGCAKDSSSTLNRSHGGYGNGKQVMKNYIYAGLLPLLDKIAIRGIGVMLLTHAKRVDITDIDGVTTEKTSADIADDYLSIIVEWSDFVCLARKDPKGNRVMITEETPRALAKNRYGMPPVVDFNWPSFVAAISGKGANG